MRARTGAERLLVLLRSDPEVLAALAEALHEPFCSWMCAPEQDAHIPEQWWNERAAALLDALLGKPA